MAIQYVISPGWTGPPDSLAAAFWATCLATERLPWGTNLPEAMWAPEPRMLRWEWGDGSAIAGYRHVLSPVQNVTWADDSEARAVAWKLSEAVRRGRYITPTLDAWGQGDGPWTWTSGSTNRAPDVWLAIHRDRIDAAVALQEDGASPWVVDPRHAPWLA